MVVVHNEITILGHLLVWFVGQTAKEICIKLCVNSNNITGEMSIEYITTVAVFQF